MNFRIPKHRREVLFTLSNLPDEAVKELFAALAQVPPEQYGPELPSRVSAALARTKIPNVEEIIDTLLSLFPLIISQNKSVNDVIESIIKSLKLQPQQEKAFDNDQLEQLRNNLQKLLRVPSMSLGAKATSVLFENERNLLNSRVLTDIRPVFQLETTDIGGAVILHTLKLEYSQDGGGEKEFFVSLDSTDVSDLIHKLQRAQEKGAKLKDMLKAASVPLINSGDV